MASPIQVQKIATLTGHRDCVYTLEQSAEPNVFYSAAGDGMVVAWNLLEPETGQLVANVPGSVYALHYLPKQHWLLVGHNYQGLQVLDLEKKQVIKTVALSAAPIFDLQHHPELPLVYAGLGDGSLLQVDLETFLVKRVEKWSSKSLRCLAINKSRNELAAGYSDHFIRIFDAETLALKHEYPAHANSVFTVTYSPNEQFLLSAGRDAHIKAWSVAQQYEEHVSVVAHLYAINHLTYSPDGRYLASCSMDKAIKIWDARNLKLLKVIDKARHAGHGTSVNKLFWSAHNNQLVSCSDDRSISVWDLKFSTQYEGNTVRNQAKNI